MAVHNGFVAAILLFIATAATSSGPVQNVARVVDQQQATSDQQQIIEELRTIRRILQDLSKGKHGSEGPLQTLRLANLKGYSIGNSAAPLALVEFTDLECQFCREYALNTFAKIKANWIDSGRLLYVSRDLPLGVHPLAINAAVAARCGGDQGRFWEMRAAIFARTGGLTRDAIVNAAVDVGLDQPRFAACHAGGSHEADVRAELAEGERLGVRGTPTFVLGRRTKDGALDGLVILGAQPYEVFEGHLRNLMARAN